MDICDAWLGVLFQPAVAYAYMILDRNKVLLLDLHVLIKVSADKGVPIRLRLLWFRPDCSEAGTIEVNDIVLQSTSHALLCSTLSRCESVLVLRCAMALAPECLASQKSHCVIRDLQ